MDEKDAQDEAATGPATSASGQSLAFVAVAIDPTIAPKILPVLFRRLAVPARTLCGGVCRLWRQWLRIMAVTASALPDSALRIIFRNLRRAETNSDWAWTARPSSSVVGCSAATCRRWARVAHFCAVSLSSFVDGTLASAQLHARLRSPCFVHCEREPHERTCVVCFDSDPAPVLSGCACKSNGARRLPVLAHVDCLIEKAVSQQATQQGSQGYAVWWACQTCKQKFAWAMRMGLGKAWWARVRGQAEDSQERLAAANNLAEARTARRQSRRDHIRLPPPMRPQRWLLLRVMRFVDQRSISMLAGVGRRWRALVRIRRSAEKFWQVTVAVPCRAGSHAGSDTMCSASTFAASPPSWRARMCGLATYAACRESRGRGSGAPIAEFMALVVWHHLPTFLPRFGGAGHCSES